MVTAIEVPVAVKVEITEKTLEEETGIEWPQKRAQDFNDKLIIPASKATNENIRIGFDDSWLTDKNHGVQLIISSLSRLSELKNIIIVRGRGHGLGRELLKEADKSNTAYSDIVVLGSRETISAIRTYEYGKLTSSVGKKGACLVEVDPTNQKKDIPEDEAV